MSARPDRKRRAKRGPSRVQAALRRARVRWGLNLLLQHAAVGLLAAGLAVALAVAAERTMAVTVVNLWTAAALGGAVVLATVGWWYLTFPSRMRVAVMVDERLGLRERFSTTLAFAGSADPFAEAARSEARGKAARLRLRERFPIRLSRRWALTATAWAIAAAVIAFLPTMDLLGSLAQRLRQEQRQTQLSEARAEVRQAAQAVQAKVGELGDAELTEDLAGLERIEAAQGSDVRRQAIRKLGDLSELLKKKLSADELAATHAMRQMLKGLRGSREALSRELSRALAKGDFAAAAEMVKQLQKKLAEGKLSDQEAQAMAKQLADLGKQLDDLAEKQKEAEKLLEQEGLDKKLAKMGQKDLRQALKDKGLSDEEIEKLMRKLAACKAACENCRGLAEALAGAGEGMTLTPEELAELLDRLEELDAVAGKLEAGQDLLEEIERAIALLGEGDCEGGAGDWRPGLALVQGRGTGGPGRGAGPRKEDPSGLTGTKATRSPSQTGKGKIIAASYFKGRQVKGESKKDFARVAQAARDRAADAIDENKIPRKYAPAVKDYFDKFNRSGGREKPQ